MEESVTNQEKYITKANGERVVFKLEKLQNSLRSAGAGEEDIANISDHILSELKQDSSTKAIYRKAFTMLKQRSEGAAGRYKLKKALTELGPSGYPFEKYIAEILRFQAYEVRTGVFIEGKCLEHEVDVHGVKDGHHIYVECKFHNNPSAKSDVKVPLYVLARFEDMVKKQHGGNFKEAECWVVTNTRFTEEAIKYGSCNGLQLIAWDFPHRGSLKERIEISGLHPLTCLSSLSKKQKQVLLENKVVLCRELLANENLLREAGVNERKVNEVLREVLSVCSPSATWL